jgi:hypothetical protein
MNIDMNRALEVLVACGYECPEIERMREELAAAHLNLEQKQKALENIRLFSARHRKDEWATHVLRFCSEGGATGSPMRSTEALADRDRKRDAALLREVFDKFYVSKISLCALADKRESGEWEPELEVK